MMFSTPLETTWNWTHLFTLRSRVVTAACNSVSSAPDSRRPAVHVPRWIDLSKLHHYWTHWAIKRVACWRQLWKIQTHMNCCFAVAFSSELGRKVELNLPSRLKFITACTCEICMFSIGTHTRMRECVPMKANKKLSCRRKAARCFMSWIFR